jgi:hypothetical protein
VKIWILALLLTSCGTPPGPFECGGKALTTVPSTAVCDGVIDCWGGQDERADTCATELFYCDQPEPEAILADRVCDDQEDCGDGADEADCP